MNIRIWSKASFSAAEAMYQFSYPWSHSTSSSLAVLIILSGWDNSCVSKTLILSSYFWKFIVVRFGQLGT